MQSIEQIERECQKIGNLVGIFNFFPKKEFLKEKLYLFPFSTFPKEFPENHMMPAGICINGKKLHFNIFFKKQGIIYRLEPHKHVSLQYPNIDNLLGSIPIYKNNTGKECVIDAFNMLYSFVNEI